MPALLVYDGGNSVKERSSFASYLSLNEVKGWLIKMEYEIKNGVMFFCVPNNQLQYRAVMRDKVDREDLQEAVNTAMQRYPYLCTELVRRGGRLFLRENDKPFLVYEGEKHIPPGAEENGGHLFSFGCNDNMIIINFFHGIADGRGALPPFMSVIHYYIRRHYGEDLRAAGLRLADEKVDCGEFADPFEYLGYMENNDVEAIPPQNVFRIPKSELAEPEEAKVKLIRIPADKFISYAKTLSVAPSTLMTLFLARAIDKVYPMCENDILIEAPLDARNHLKCEKTMQNCISCIRYVLDGNAAKMTIAEQAKFFRNTMSKQREDSFILKYMDKLRRVVTFVEGELEKHEKITMPPDVAAPVVTYIGRVDAGEMKKYLKEVYASFYAPTEPFVAVFANHKDFLVSYGTREKSSACYKAFLDEITNAKIPYREEFEIPAPPIPRPFGMFAE